MSVFAILAAAATFVASILSIKDKSKQQSKMEDNIAKKVIEAMKKDK